jgi:hypothetical protein
VLKEFRKNATGDSDGAAVGAGNKLEFARQWATLTTVTLLQHLGSAVVADNGQVD